MQFSKLIAAFFFAETHETNKCKSVGKMQRSFRLHVADVLFVFLALQPIVIVFSQPGSGL
jgi:hypothetical protein